jgi:hypothetical protein
MTRRFAIKAFFGLSLLTLALIAALMRPMPAGAATQTVALVVQTGPGSKPAVNCVGYTKDMSGFDVLRAAEHEIQYQAKTYAMVRIDGTPTPPKIDSTHYWAYFSRAPGHGWVRNTKTGAVSRPQPGTVDAWIYVDGKAYNPPDETFDRICGPTPVRTITQSPTSRPSATSTAAPPVRGSTSSRGTSTVKATVSARSSGRASGTATTTTNASGAIVDATSSEPPPGTSTNLAKRQGQTGGLILLLVAGVLGLAGLFAVLSIRRANRAAPPSARHRQ